MHTHSSHYTSIALGLKEDGRYRIVQKESRDKMSKPDQNEAGVPRAHALDRIACDCHVF